MIFFKNPGDGMSSINKNELDVGAVSRMANCNGKSLLSFYMRDQRPENHKFKVTGSCGNTFFSERLFNTKLPTHGLY